MKIIKEDINTNNVPEMFVADFLSNGWQEVAQLQSTIAALDEFADSADLKCIFQDLLDAYLVFLGQLEGRAPKNLSVTKLKAAPAVEVVPVAIPPEIKTAAECNDPVHPEPTTIVTNPQAQGAFDGASDYFVDFDDPTPDFEADNAMEAAKEELFR